MSAPVTPAMIATHLRDAADAITAIDLLELPGARLGSVDVFVHGVADLDALAYHLGHGAVTSEPDGMRWITVPCGVARLTIFAAEAVTE